MSVAAQAVHGLKVCVIPNPDNDFRPLVLRHRPLAAVTALLLIIKIVAVSALAVIPATAELSTITSAKIVELTNVQRRKAGFGDLKTNSLLTNAAGQKAQDMLAKDYFAHISPDGVTPWFWMAKVGYGYEIAGENLAIDFTEAEDVVAAWLASPTHKENMLLPGYTETGVAVASGEFQGGTSIVVVHMFGKGVGTVAAKKTFPSPTPIPTSSPISTPLPTPIPQPSDTNPPRVPRIALAGSATVVKQSTEVIIEGDPNSLVRILINNQAKNSLTLPTSGQAKAQLDLSELPEGTLVVRAYAVDTAGNESEVSDALALTKDTIGPLIDENALAFALSPSGDAVAVHLPDGWKIAGAPQEPISVTLSDEHGNETKLANVSFTPKFISDIRQDELTLPTRAQQFSRRMSALIAGALLVLLIFAVLIQVRVQRPALIAHASIVIFIAIGLFLL